MPAAIATASPDQNSGPTEMAKVLRNLQHAVSQCQDSIFITDAAGVVTRVNPAFERLSGYTPLEFVGKDLSLIIEGGAQSVDYQHLWRRVFEEKQYTRTTS
jgi:PAS domain S-box-containing protein